MKKPLFLFALIISTQSLFAQKDADQILGTWLTGTGNARVEIYKNVNHVQFITGN